MIRFRQTKEELVPDQKIFWFAHIYSSKVMEIGAPSIERAWEILAHHQVQPVPATKRRWRWQCEGNYPEQGGVICSVVPLNVNGILAIVPKRR